MRSKLARLTSASAIRSLETTHCDSFAQSVGDERERGQIWHEEQYDFGDMRT